MANVPGQVSTGDNNDEKYKSHVAYTKTGSVPGQEDLKKIEVWNEVENGRHHLTYDAASNRVSVTPSGMEIGLLVHLLNELIKAVEVSKQ